MPYVTQVLDGRPGPVVAVSDWIRAVPDQIARWVPAPYTSLGTDGYGFSDTRAAARRFFHVDAESITVAVLGQLAKRGEVKPDVLTQAIEKYRLDLPVSEALRDPQAVSQPAAPGTPRRRNPARGPRLGSPAAPGKALTPGRRKTSCGGGKPG